MMILWIYSKEIGQTLFDDIKSAAPETVITDCETCKWQIEHFSGLPVENPISILAKAIDFEITQALNEN